ncbi:response regulator [Caballeronia fortuita]|nr:response regulator [Caballeronia fortuita]
MQNSTNRPIVVVEDDESDLELLQIAFERANTTQPVVALRDGQQALDYLLREGEFAGRVGHDPEFVLLDIKMPRVTGLEVLKAMRESDALRDIPVVAFTSSVQEQDVVRAYDLGISAYVVKPTDFTEYTRNIANIKAVWGSLNESPPEFRQRVHKSES